ncbi:fibronectin type III domain-containing protein [Actinomadura rupiterrae]|uniref:fibronectin type III domain-containing protein n=1 Tax=Actinomadura rupiterrae TaxID=559627 RepID=UPI0020A422A4|nr:fibronectin type III domain-containing protein [Actinomadura rupiterrae]MCP2339130.1 hypothetical protein [Actinomadura rupiterrae]
MIAAAATVATGLVAFATSTPASADTPQLSLDYRCDYPLIGMQDVHVDISSDIPDTTTAGVQNPAFNIKAVSTIGADTTFGLNTMGATTIEGSAKAQAKVYSPDYPNGVGANTTVTLDKANVPASGPFSVNAAGKTPALEFDTAGWGAINVGNLTLTVTPKDAAGNPTALGTLTVNCFQKPGQHNVLKQFYVDDGKTPKPPKPDPVDKPVTGPTEYGNPTYPSNPHEITLTYMCPYPLIGKHPLSVKATIDYPATVKVGDYAPPIHIKSISTTDDGTVEGLNALDPAPATIEGSAKATSTLIVPEITGYPDNGLKAYVNLPIAKTSIPATGHLEIPAEGDAPKMVFKTKGKGYLKVNDIVLTMTPRLADGSPQPDIGTFTKTCVQDAGQQNTIASFDIVDNTTVPHPAVTGLTAGTPTDTTVPLSWTAPSGATPTGYEVYNGSTKVADVPAGTTSYTVSGLSASTKYTLGVVAVYSDGGKSDPATVDATTSGTQPQPPAKVTGLTGTPGTDKVDLKWDPSANATSYEVYNGSTKVTETAATNFTVTGLQPSTKYTFGVVAVNKDGKADPTTVEVTTADAPKPPPAAVTGLAANGPTDTTIPVTWNPSTDATSYEVDVNGTKVADNITDTKYTVSGLTPVTKYTITVYAVNVNGKSDPASIEASTGTTPIPLPQPVTGLAVDGTPTTTGVNLKWTAGKDAKSYTIYNGSTKIAENVTDTKYSVTGLKPSTKYTFGVVSVNDAGQSSPVTVDVTTPDEPGNPPADVTGIVLASAPDATSATIKWNPSSGADSYEVTVNGKTDTVKVPQDTITGLTANTKYTVSIVAVNKFGKSKPATFEFTTGGNGNPGGKFAYTLAGSSFVKAANGTVKLTGGIQGDVDSSGKFTGSLTLNKTSGTFQLLGFIPATADVDFAQQGQTTGTLSGSSLTSNSKMIVKLPSVKVFGFEVGGGTTCQTTAPADITLKSTDFNQASGGNLTGTYTLPSVSGCGMLNSLISALTAGPGNTVAVKLTKAG